MSIDSMTDEAVKRHLQKKEENVTISKEDYEELLKAAQFASNIIWSICNGFQYTDNSNDISHIIKEDKILSKDCEDAVKRICDISNKYNHPKIYKNL